MSLFEARRKQVEGELHQCEQQQHDLEKKLQESSTTQESLFSLLTLQNGIGRIRAELAWMQATLDRLPRR
jgi:hypothetical protein